MLTIASLMNKTLLKKITGFDFFLFLYAFLCGNLFTIQCSKLDWGLFLIFGVVFSLEIIQKFAYSVFYQKESNQNFIPCFFFVTLVKRGFLLGFFIEAFKVGS
jgi:hypothetical protein